MSGRKEYAQYPVPLTGRSAKGEKGEEAGRGFGPLPACLLFYRAGRTAEAEKRILRFLRRLGGSLLEASAVQEEGELLRALNGMLGKARCVFVVSGADGGRPEAAGPIFKALGAEPAAEGGTEAFRPLLGERLRGYLPESREKAVCLLPDDGEEEERMLQEACRRLSEKFSLPYIEEEPAFLDTQKEGKALRAFFKERGVCPREAERPE